jgi:hypothetical protein
MNRHRFRRLFVAQKRAVFCRLPAHFRADSGSFSASILAPEPTPKSTVLVCIFGAFFDVISGGAAKLPRSKSFPIAETGLLHLSHNVYYGKYEKDEKIASDGARFPVRKTRLRKGRLGADFRASQGHSRVPVSNGFPVRFRRSPGVGNAASGGRKNDAFSAH